MRFHAGWYVALVFSLLFLCSCSSSSDDALAGAGSGSIVFSIELPEGAQREASGAALYYKAASIPCEELGIASVQAEVYDENDTLIASGGPWPCNLGEGIISSVEAGYDRAVFINLYDENGEIIYLGQTDGIRVIAGQISNAGTISVSAVGNHPPVLTPIGTRSVAAGSNINFTITASDPDDDTLSFYAADLPRDGEGIYLDASFNRETQTFDWTTQTSGDDGEYKLLFIVTDDGSPPMSDYEEVIIRVEPGSYSLNHSPVLAPIGAKDIVEGSLLEFDLYAIDEDEDQITFSSQAVTDKEYPIGFTLETLDPASGTGAFAWAIIEVVPGNYSIMIIATDNTDDQNTDMEEVIITVGDVNRPPVLTPIGDRQISNNYNFSFTLSATDFEDDDLTYSIEEVSPGAGLPSGMSIDPDTQVFTWQLVGNYMDPADYYVRFRVTDDGNPSESDFEDVTITVLEGGRIWGPEF